MRSRLATLVLSVALLAPAADAAARPPVGGGYFNGEVATPCDPRCNVILAVADDGRSLTSQSLVEARCPSRAHRAYSEWAPRATAIRADGSFRWQTDLQVVEGRFSADGQSASGTSRFLGRARSDCGSETTAFSVVLMRRIAPDGTCEPLLKGRTFVSVYVRHTGCTRATRVVDSWRLDRDCVTTRLELRPCRTAGRRCAPVAGGVLKSFAGVACAAGRSRIEFVIREDCGQLAFSLALRAINVSCAAARAVGRRWQRRPCGAHCTAAGWTCRRSGNPRPLWSCREGHRGVEIFSSIVQDYI